MTSTKVVSNKMGMSLANLYRQILKMSGPNITLLRFYMFQFQHIFQRNMFYYIFGQHKDTICFVQLYMVSDILVFYQPLVLILTKYVTFTIFYMATSDTKVFTFCLSFYARICHEMDIGYSMS